LVIENSIAAEESFRLLFCDILNSSEFLGRILVVDLLFFRLLETRAGKALEEYLNNRYHTI
jgi:hypothetical protein